MTPTQVPQRRRRASRVHGAVGLAAVALLAAACASSGRSGPTRIEATEGGFVLREEVSVGLGVRSDFERAVRLLREGATEEGIALLVELTGSAPHLTAAHVNLGIAYREAGDVERSRASLERAVEQSPKHPVARNELGITLRRSGRFEEARKSYEEALRLYPAYHFARRNLAILCDLYLADTACALEHYELYLAAVPADEDAAIWVADLRNRVGR